MADNPTFNPTYDPIYDQSQTERLFAEAMPEGIVVLDEKNHIQWWNQRAQALLLLGDDHNREITEIIKDENLIKILQKKSTEQLEMDSPFRPEIRLNLKLHPYLDGKQLLIVQDITAHYRIQAMRQDFVANVSHELRTPITVFRGYLELLESQEQFDREQFKEVLEHMSSQSQRMERLVQDLLLLSTLESEVPHAKINQEIVVADMLQDIITDAKTLSGSDQHQFTLEADQQLTLMGRFDEIRSAFSNIIYNAVRYTPANGKIDIRWYQDQNGKHMQVTDTGIGIAEKYIPLLTQRFYRVDKARLSGKGGTGLGLAIVKHVLLRHGGKLSIESRLNNGSTFRCSFPLTANATHMVQNIHQANEVNAKLIK